MDDLNIWKKWQQEALAKREVLPDRITKMHKMYGEVPGKTCKLCVHLIQIRYANTYHKCNLTRITGGPGTDWRTGWPACGRYHEGEQKKYEGSK